ncbi:MAG: hypothetical protein ACP5OG_01610 [Candidatus Nanoarchaeia archaeon]
MLPKTHIILGFVFSLLLFYFFDLSFFQSSLVFFSSFLIDFDHYIWYILRKKDFSLKHAYYFLKNLKTNKKIMVVFHTFEFLIFTAFLSYFYSFFLYILIGMLFHSIMDVIDMGYKGTLNNRGYSLLFYIFSNKKEYY